MGREDDASEKDTVNSYVGKARNRLHSQYNIDDLPEDDVKRILSNLPEDDSKPVDAYALTQNEIRREVSFFYSIELLLYLMCL